MYPSIGTARQGTVNVSPELTITVSHQLGHGPVVKVLLLVLQSGLQPHSGTGPQRPPSHRHLAVHQTGGGAHLQHRAEAPAEALSFDFEKVCDGRHDCRRDVNK